MDSSVAIAPLGPTEIPASWARSTRGRHAETEHHHIGGDRPRFGPDRGHPAVVARFEALDADAETHVDAERDQRVG